MGDGSETVELPTSEKIVDKASDIAGVVADVGLRTYVEVTDFWMRYHPGIYAAFSGLNINEASEQLSKGDIGQAIFRGIVGVAFAGVAFRQGNVVRQFHNTLDEAAYKAGKHEEETGRPVDRVRLAEHLIDEKEKEEAKKPLWKRILKI